MKTVPFTAFETPVKVRESKSGSVSLASKEEVVRTMLPSSGKSNEPSATATGASFIPATLMVERAVAELSVPSLTPMSMVRLTVEGFSDMERNVIACKAASKSAIEPGPVRLTVTGPAEVSAPDGTTLSTMPAVGLVTSSKSPI